MSSPLQMTDNNNIITMNPPQVDYVNLLEPPPTILVSELDASYDYTNTVTLCAYTAHNVCEVVRKMFDELTFGNVRFEFNPLSATWNCSYFPHDYIAEVAFMFSLWHQNGVLLIEKVYLSGHRETYDELCVSHVGEVFDFMNPVHLHTQ